VRDAEVSRAVEILREGGLVAFPTETVYGLGADAANVDALRRLYAVKHRPPDHPVIVHLGDPAQLDEWAIEPPPVARELATSCWPGSLTIVVRRSSRVPDEVTGGRDTVALRVPNHPIALRLLRAFGRGVAAPSANRFGRVSPTTADDVRDDLGRDVDLVLDGGPCTVGVESTIVDCTGGSPVILRLGGVGPERVESILGTEVIVATDVGGAPGTLPSHYAPQVTVVVANELDVATQARKLLEHGTRVGVLATHEIARLPAGVVELDPPGSTSEYARVLYSRFREADRLGLEVLLAVPAWHSGVGQAVNDRLARAAGMGS
jgi:L-threonylcarbamoyladenylate synthase